MLRTEQYLCSLESTSDEWTRLLQFSQCECQQTKATLIFVEPLCGELGIIETMAVSVHRLFKVNLKINSGPKITVRDDKIVEGECLAPDHGIILRSHGT